jgi:hypothetical protein
MIKWIAGLFAATALLAQQKSVLGTVTEFRVAAMQLAVKPDTGATQVFAIGPDTEVMRVPPGETTLERARPGALGDLALGDRVLASFVDGLPEARRIVVVTLGDIARRNEAERADWQRRGVSGVVTARTGDDVTIAVRAAQTGQTAVLAISPQTKVRRYAAGSVKFTAAVPGSIAEIAVGDQVQARGAKSADGSRIAADDIVFGTFLTKIGSITAVNRETHEIEIAEAADGRAWKIHLTAESQMKTMPDMRAVLAVASSGRHASAPPAAVPAPHSVPITDMARTLLALPPARLDDLKIGGGVVVTSAASPKPGELTAILLLTNADFLVRLSKPQKDGESPGMDAFVKMHGGMLGGGGGLSLPAIIP